MNYLKRIRQKIDDFCINKMREPKSGTTLFGEL